MLIQIWSMGNIVSPMASWLPALELGHFLPLNLFSLWIVLITFHLNNNSAIYLAENRTGFWKAVITFQVLSEGFGTAQFVLLDLQKLPCPDS